MTLNVHLKYLFRSRAIMNTYFFFGSFFFSFLGRKDENIGDNPRLRKSDNVSQLPFSVFILTFYKFLKNQTKIMSNFFYLNSLWDGFNLHKYD